MESPKNSVPLRLQSARLVLVSATRAHLEAELSGFSGDIGNHPLAALLDADLPTRWPPEFYESADLARYLEVLKAHPSDAGWGMWYLLHRASPSERTRAIGIAGFTGPPDAEGMVTLGYSIVPTARGRGYASEAAGALIVFAFADKSVTAIAAETFPDLVPSVGVLLKCGFEPGPGAKRSGAIRFLRVRPKP